MFSRLIYGTRIALVISLASVGLALLAGSLLGVLAGFGSRNLDQLISRIADALLSIPDILLALTLIAVLGDSMLNLILTLAIVYCPIFVRIARTATLQIRSEEYILASRLLGASRWQIMTRHILPNIQSPLLTQVSISIAFAILAEATLSFLGFGVEPDLPSWGVMLREGKDWLQQAWWLAVFPGIMITLTSLSCHLIGDAMGNRNS